jgi:membrane-bound lytic murein transglycosylase B
MFRRAWNARACRDRRRAPAGRRAAAGLAPLDDRLLTRTEKEELQQRLARQGFDPGPVDGKVGAKTRAAIRDFQKKQGVPADGYANYALLERARRAGGGR